MAKYVSVPTPMSSTSRSGDEEVSEANLAARIQKQQRGQPVGIEDVAEPDEVEVKHTEEHQPHVAAERRCRRCSCCRGARRAR